MLAGSQDVLWPTDRKHQLSRSRPSSDASSTVVCRADDGQMAETPKFGKESLLKKIVKVLVL
jgi:hypothetical protein